MKKYLPCFAFTFLALIAVQDGFSQCVQQPVINFINPSFEDSVSNPFPAHITPGPWSECLAGQTPDTQPGNWGVTMPPTHGVSYLGLVHQSAAGWQEGAAEQLSSPMVAGTSYTFSIDLANSSTTGGGIDPGCAECQIWGGFGPCDNASGTGVLLWSSGDITPMDTWMTYTPTVTPTQNFTWIMIQVNSLGCSTQPYILVDNIGPIVPENVSILSTTINQNIACPGMSNGQATVHAIGQYTPFTYVWNSTPPQTDSVLNNVPAGSYSVTVTDANTCSATATIAITAPQPIVLTPTINHVTCFGMSTGSAYMSYSGGTVPLGFQWSNNNITTQNNGNLAAATYTFTATDANSCSATSSITINQPAQLSISGVPVSPTCSVSGSITTTTTGGTTGYTYSWNTTPVQTTPNATNLGSGSYTVVVTDANTCTATATFNLTPPSNSPSITLTPADANCFGVASGSVSSSVTGGTPGYTYAWNTTPAQTNPNAVNIPAGTYTLVVTDAVSCTASASATVNQPTALNVTATPVDVLCFGQSTGSVSASPAGGTSGYTYSWNSTPAQTTPTASNLPAGSFTVIVTDANTCTATATATVNQPASPLAVTETNIDVLCFGDTTGSATGTAIGGTTNYSYSWNTTPPQTTSAISGLSAGTYMLVVTDANNCTASVSSVVIEPPSAVSVTIALTAPVCFGDPPASATANGAGGTSGYNYSWNTTPAQNTQTITNMAQGSYIITVTDANSCTATATTTVPAAPTQLVLSVSHVDVPCFGDATGSVSVNASGSYGGYSYSWNSNPVQNTSIATQLVAGTYNVSVTDVQGCSATASDIITQPPSPLSVSTTTTDALCFGDANGSAIAIASGGTSGYGYLWNSTPQQNSDTLTLVSSGSYTVTVTDAHSCTLTANVTVNQPAQLTAASLITNVNCNGASDGAIAVTASGGVTAYSYQWSTVPSVNSPNATGLPPGNYSVTVTDANNCTFSIPNMAVTEPAALTLNPVIADVSCPNHGDGSIDANPGGGTPAYTFAWSAGGSTTQLNSNLSGGSYSVTVTDSHGCTLSASNLNVIELPGVSMSGTVTNVLCFPLQNGAIDVSASSSFLPVQYDWSNGETTQDLMALDTGTYSIVVTDAHGCTAGSSFHVGNDSIFSIDATPAVSTINLGESVNLDVVAIGSSFGTVVWTPLHGLTCDDCPNPSSSPLDNMTYFVLGTDVNGCVASDIVRVNVIPKYVVFVPNAFTPNGDGVNDYFEIFGNKEAWKQVEVNVFDRLGEKVFWSNDMNFKWDGTYRGKLMNPTVLVYMFRVVYIDNHTDELYKGSITLLR